MLQMMFAMQMRDGSQSWRLRGWCIGSFALLLLAYVIRHPHGVVRTVELVTWVQFFLAVVIGGSLTGWRVTQFPKSRAAEFHLAMPVSDWVIVGGDLLSGMVRTALVMMTALPIIAAMYGAGWVDFPQAFAMFSIPLACGWLVGISLAVVAYSPVWLRRVIEIAMMILVLAYLILFGLAAQFFLPWLLMLWIEYSKTSIAVWIDPNEAMRYFNPFRLLGVLGQEEQAQIGLRVAAVLAMLLGLCGLGAWRLQQRLRAHYLEENYGNQYRKKEYVKPIRDNPLAWWTHRRVSRFRGQINVYLGWATIGLFSAWMIFHASWPTWLGPMLMLAFHIFGGQAMLGVFALQFGLVATAFLSGLWDSNPQQRVGRLELLLVSPLEAQQFLEGSIAASWTRGKQFLAMAVFVWTMAVLADRIAWWNLALLLPCAAIYVFAYFALAFRNFTFVKSDRASASWGMAMSLGSPFLTMACFMSGFGKLGAVTPLGGIFLLALPANLIERLTGWPWYQALAIILVAFAAYFVLGVWLLRTTLASFDHEIRAWFAYHLISPDVRKSTAPAEAAPATAVALAKSSG